MIGINLRRTVLIILAAIATSASAAPATDDPAITQAKSVMTTDPAHALALARLAERHASGPDAALAAARAQWLQGEALSRLDRAAEATPILEKALAVATRDAPGSALRGDILLSRGWVEETDGAIGHALNDFQQAFRLYRVNGEKRGQAKALQFIAGIYQDAGDNIRSLRYYSQAAEIYRGDPVFSIAAHNNVGETLRVLGRYADAESQYRIALAAARRDGSPLLQANILTNLASTLLSRKQPNQASAVAREAFSLSAQREAADERPFVFGVLAQIAMRQGEFDRAAAMISQTFAGVDLEKSSLRYRDFHKLAADIYDHQGRSDLAFAHLRAFKRLDDGVREVATSTNAALMAAQFDFSNQNLRILQLQANRAKLHETMLLIAVAGVGTASGLMLIGLLSLRRSRNKVRTANDRLGEVNHELETALKAKSDFLAMTSHEIRTPLNGILGMTQVMLADRQIVGPLRTRIEVVHGAGETMRTLVDDILDLSKMETGKLVVNRAAVALPKLVTDAENLWRDKAESKGIDLRIDVEACPPTIEEDGDRLRQILFNLLSNAVKFTERGAVTLRVDTQANGDQEDLRITVADTGIGISPDQHELIFEKFQQADASTSRRYGGTGLGLAICRNLAKALDGTIFVESRVGEGATFRVTLPLRRLDTPSEQAAPHHNHGAHHFLSEASVVLLEPNALTQRIIAKGLSGSIGSLTCVADCEALLRALDDQRVDHVVLQVGAAGPQGADNIATIASLVAAANAHGAKCTILFADSDGIDVSQLLTLGAGAALKKPVTGDILVEALRSLADRHEDRIPPLASAA